MAKLLVYSGEKPYTSNIVGEVNDGELIIVDDAVATKILESVPNVFTDVTADSIEDTEVDFPGVEAALAAFEASVITTVTRVGPKWKKILPA